MRNYVITDVEKEIILRYLADGTRLEGFSVLKNRFYTAYPEILKNIKILVEFYGAIEDDAPPQVREQVQVIREWVSECLKDKLAQ